MSRRDPDVLIDDILTALRKIERYISGMDRDAFLKDDKTADAVLRNLHVVGEAVNRLPREFCEKHPSVPWQKIVGLRHRTVHDYAGVDWETIWNILQKETVELRRYLEQL
ncbi:DUF86 domain-containing protein [Candidatus Sumerlaeota bacterium]|nr:DUF86 domain-containing protein [Candidatus Sumerlaeota bacterium]